MYKQKENNSDGNVKYKASSSDIHFKITTCLFLDMNKSKLEKIQVALLKEKHFFLSIGKTDLNLEIWDKKKTKLFQEINTDENKLRVHIFAPSYVCQWSLHCHSIKY